ncbi:MAG: SirB2 family protein [Mariprofundaceae bacterium]
MEIIKFTHISCVLLSILFFTSRGVIMFYEPSFVSRAWVQRVAKSIDTALLLSGMTLAWLTEQLPWQDAWLGAKLILLLFYILLGMVAFHWGRSRTVKFVSWGAAVGVYATMVFIALTKTLWPFAA